MTTFRSTLSGTSLGEIVKSEWGDTNDAPEAARTARQKVLAAPTRPIGRGIQAKLELTAQEAEELATFLDTLAGSMVLDIEQNLTDEVEIRIQRNKVRAVNKDADRWANFIG